MENKHLALEAIRKKLIGKKLSYKEIYAIMDQIAQDKLGDVLTTYFVASGYSQGFSSEEIYYLTRAMVETGDRIQLSGIVADKHSIGGLPGTRTTLIVVPIIAAAGFQIPKSSSRAITTPAGTADVMEVFAKVSFSIDDIYSILKKTNGCIVWGGSFKIAPADDEIIRVEEPLLFESYDKILVSVMAKKIAFGSTHLVIDLPYGKNMKVGTREDAQILQGKFEDLASRFNIKIKVLAEKSDQPAGNGIGPLLEGRDALLVLEQDKNRPAELEKKAIRLAASLLELCLADASAEFRHSINALFPDTKAWAKDLLERKIALSKFKEIIKAQGGDADIVSSKLLPGKSMAHVTAQRAGIVQMINSKNISLICRILGAPGAPGAGIYLHKRVGDNVKKGDVLCDLYSASAYKIKEAHDSLDMFPLHFIKEE